MSPDPTSTCRTNCPSSSQLSPCTLPPSLAKSRCSSVLLSDQHCQYSRVSCGSLSPICCGTANNNEIKIIITDPQNNSVFSSFHDPYGRENQNTATHFSSSPFLSSLHTALLQRWSGVIIIFWTVLAPAMVGLLIGFTMGWTSLPGLAVSACLLFASVSLLILIILILTAKWVSLDTRRSLCSTLPGDSCLSPATHRENSIISCAEKKISRTEFFTVD